ETCVLLSFGPPRLAPLGISCPVVPVFSWAFPTLPSGSWNGDPRSDWRYVLRQTGRAIVFSRFAAEAVIAAMGADYPVAAIPAPPANLSPPPLPAPALERQIAIEGVVFDSREHSFDPDDLSTPSPVWRPSEAPGGVACRVVTVDGVLFASALELNDGRRN